MASNENESETKLRTILSFCSVKNLLAIFMFFLAILFSPSLISDLCILVPALI